MATIRRFEDVKAWQKARELTNHIYKISKRNLFSKDYALRDQIRRASISVLSNIAEGFERNRPKEFVQFLIIAKGSLGEVKAQMYIALDEGYIKQEEFEAIQSMAVETGSMIFGLIDYLKTCKESLPAK